MIALSHADAAFPHRDHEAWELFPDAPATLAPTDVDAAAIAQRERTNMIRGFAIVGSIGAATWAVSLYSTGLAMLIFGIVMVVAVVFALRSGQIPLLRAGMTSWANERGLEDQGGKHWTGDGVDRIPADAIAPSIAAVQAAGLYCESSQYQSIVAGRLWGAATGATIVNVMGGFSDESRLTLINIPLDPRVAARYAGVVVEYLHPTDVLQRGLARAWAELEFERAKRSLGFRICAHPQQEHLAAWELFDPAFLDGLERTVGGEPIRIDGFVVTHGMLSIWAHGDLLRGLASERAYVDMHKPAGIHEDSAARMQLLLEMTRDVHRRVAAEHR